MKLRVLMILPALTAAFCVAQATQPPLPDVPTLMKQVEDHQHKLDQVRENYTYHETIITHELDNTLFVYTSDFGETHHSTGNDWAYVLLGNLGGKLKTGQYIDYPIYGKKGNRSINALYCTLLHAAGAPRDHFNLEGALKNVDSPGPLSELLA